jgi:hypothetical protein
VPTFGFKFMVPEVAELGSAPPAVGPKLSARGKDEPEAPPKRPQGLAPASKASAPGKPVEPSGHLPAAPKATEKAEAAKVVSIDAFRKK